jgi:hypothetical protein
MTIELVPIADVATMFVELCIGLVEKVRSPLVVRLSELYFQDVDGGGPVAAATPQPRRYVAELDVTNRSVRPVLVKNIALKMAGGGGFARLAEHAALRLRPGETCRHQAAFRLNADEQPVETVRFRIEVRPSIGRTAVVKGRSPTG